MVERSSHRAGPRRLPATDRAERRLGRTADRAAVRAATLMGRNHAGRNGLSATRRPPTPTLTRQQRGRDRQPRRVTTLPPGITVTDEDPVALVRRLKHQDGTGIWLCGGGALAAALVDEIDRLVLKVNPVLLLDGTPLFAGGDYRPLSFRLVYGTPYETGVTVNEYVRSGSTRSGRRTARRRRSRAGLAVRAPRRSRASPRAGAPRRGKVATRAWSSPPVRIQMYGSTPSAGPTRRIGSGDLEGRRGHVDADTRLARRCDRGRRAARRTRRSSRWRPAWRRGPAAYGGSGRRYASTNTFGERNPRDSTAQPGRRPALPAGQRDHVARLAPRSAAPAPAVQVAERGDRDHDLVGLGHVAADHARADQLGLRGSPSASSAPRDRQVGGHGQADEQRGRAGRPSPPRRPGSAAAAWWPTSVGRRPVPAEVPALDQQVGA